MPEPVPTPTPEQIVIVAEIMQYPVELVAALVAADTDQDISNLKWLRTIADIALWEGGIRNEAGDIKRVGSIEFFPGTAFFTRLDFRNLLRARYGLPLIARECGATAMSVNVPVTWQF